MYRFVVVLFCLGWMVSCGGGEMNPAIDSKENSKNQHQLFSPILPPFRGDTSLIHVFGSNKLKRFSDKLYMQGSSNANFKIKESYPGVLTFFNTMNNSFGASKIEFYTNNKLDFKIELTDKSPYITYKNVKTDIGYLDREFYSNAEEFDLEYNLNANKFNTYTNISTDYNGNSIVEYQLIPTKSRKIIGWEETLVIYNSKGELINSIIIPEVVNSPIISSDKKYLALLIGGAQSSEFNWYKEGEFRIYDLSTKKIIYSQLESPNQTFERLFFISKEVISLGSNFKNGNKKYECFFDLKRREKIYISISKNDYKKYYSNFTNYTEFINSYIFNREKY